MTVMLPQHLQLSSCSGATMNTNPSSTMNSLSSSPSSSSNPYLIDQLHHMQHQESSHYQISSSINPYLPSWTTVSPTDRTTMITWSYDIVDACSIDREIAVIALGYFDRFLATSRAKSALLSRREFQLAFIACLIIALKCRAGMQVDSDFVSDTICQGLYDSREIVEMEREVLSVLQWRLNGPSPQEFIGGFMELLPPSVTMKCNERVVEEWKSVAKVHVEQTVLDYATVSRSSSSAIAYAALVTALSNIDGSVFHPLDKLAWMQNICLIMGWKVNNNSDGMVTSPIASAVCGASSFEAATPSAAVIKSSNSHESYLYSTPPRRLTSNDSSVTSYGSSHCSSLEQEHYGGYSYCAPVSADSSVASTSNLIPSNQVQTENNGNFAELYLDVLSMASSAMGLSGTTATDNMSPVCADMMI